MIRFRILAFAFLLGMPCTAGAAPLSVQSGEHAEFTRLVIPLPPDNRTWRVQQTGAQIILDMPGNTEGYETTTVFDLIPRTRIKALRSDKTTMTLSLNCDCAAATFVDRGAFVVIDVSAERRALAGTLIPAGADRKTSPVVARAGVPLNTQRLALPLLTPTSRPARMTFDLPGSVQDRAPLSETEKAVVTQMQSSLARQFGAAASQGVLTPAPGHRLPEEPDASGTPVPAPPISPPATTEDPVSGPLANIRVTSSRDLPTGPKGGQDILTIAGASCPPDGALDISLWGTSDPFGQQINTAREGLYDARDRLVQDVAVTLAQRYLYFGFGAEARQILALDPALAAAQQPLILIAEILDGRTPKQNQILTYKKTCDPEVALWAILAKSEPLKGAVPDPDAALRALNKLPVHLRQILAPALSRKLLHYGDKQNAALALRSLERLAQPSTSSAQLAKAELDLQIGETDRGTAQLEVVANDNSDQSPAALIALVNARISARQPIEIEAAELLASYAKMNRGTDLGVELQQAHILALLKSGQFDDAFEASAKLAGNDTTDAARALRAALLRDLTVAADDIVFLDHIFAQSSADIAVLPHRDLAALAARFLKLGFAERAERTLAIIPERQLEPAHLLLSARISLALDKPYKAQAALLGQNSDMAQKLRADAKQMVGAHDEAHRLYAQTAQVQDAAEAAWLAEDWRTLTAPETPVFGAASTLATDTGVPTDSNLGMLARTSAALTESEAARQTLAHLLEASALRIDDPG